MTRPLNKVSKLVWERKCANVKCELRTHHQFLQVFLNGKQVGAFHIPRVRALLGERREDAKD